MLVDKLLQLQTDARKRIELAENPEALEIVRIEVLGRKGSLAAISKEMGKLTPEERASVGKQLNSTKLALESAFDSKKSGFESEALAKKLDAEWVDLTLPAPGTRPGSLHPLTLIQREIEEVIGKDKLKKKD